MLQLFVDIWDQNKDALRDSFKKESPETYADIFESLVTFLSNKEYYPEDPYGVIPDPTRITVIDHGHYPGTILFIVGVEGYQPETYYSCKVSYGSCSGCDTLQSILSSGDWDAKELSEQQIEDLMTLALHMLQNLKEI